VSCEFLGKAIFFHNNHFAGNFLDSDVLEFFDFFIAVRSIGVTARAICW